MSPKHPDADEPQAETNLQPPPAPSSKDEESTSGVWSGGSSDTLMPELPSLPFRVVGIGTSAGGLEALENLFTNMPADLGMAYVVIQHLSPDYKSYMVDVLSKHTTMPLQQITHGMEIEPNHIYLIPPNRLLEMEEGTFRLQPLQQRFNLTIDIFFRSLAKEQKSNAVAIVLSGTGSDGALGSREIKGADGVVLVQAPQTAQFDGMPRNAIAVNVADVIAPPEEFPQVLRNLVNAEPIANLHPTRPFETQMDELLALVQQETGINFRHYKPSTIVRRLRHRMGILRIIDLEQYINHIHKNAEECTILAREFLINVTNFFRDPDAFQTLEASCFASLFRKKGAIRVWVVGCSTGEEAYTLAMLLQRYASKHNHHHTIKVFASDLSQEDLNHANQGQYPESIESDVPKDILRDYFRKQGDKYVIIDNVRRNVLFARHDIHRDPPFSKLDLISCRNVMIYMRSKPQRQMLSSFHYSLNEGGFLLLGGSESLGSMSSHFNVISNRWKIYQQTGNKQSTRELRHLGQRKPTAHIPPIAISNAAPFRERQAIAAARQRLMDDFLPPSFLIDQRGELAAFFGNVKPFINFPEGGVQLDAMAVIHPALALALGTAMHKLSDGTQDIESEPIHLEADGHTKHVKLLATRDEFPQSNEIYYRITLLPVTPHETVATETLTTEAQLDFNYQTHLFVKDLQQELQLTKESLQANLEEIETTNEELQATNEELLASNEELQSTNEELQSVNEELHTINAEYQEKLNQMAMLNNDLNNLLSSSDIGTLFLDRDLCIRKFTPEIKRYIHILESDIGRPLEHLKTKLLEETISQDAAEVLQSGQAHKREVSSKEGEWLQLRTMPYFTSKKTIEGVVINLVDISELKAANDQLKTLTSAIEQNPSLMLITDKDGVITFANQAMLDKTSYQMEELLGQPASCLSAQSLPESHFRDLWEQIKYGQTWQGEFQNRTKKGSYYTELATIIPLRDATGEITHYLKMAHDITEQKQLEQTLLGLQRQHLRVLIIEDEPMDAKRLKVLLHSNFFRHVTVAPDGATAYQMLHQEPPYEELKRPDLVFLDLRLPGYDGYELLDVMEELNLLKSTSVVVCSSNDELEDVTKALAKRVKSYIPKPITAEKLQDTLNSLERFTFTLIDNDA